MYVGRIRREKITGEKMKNNKLSFNYQEAD